MAAAPASAPASAAHEPPRQAAPQRPRSTARATARAPPNRSGVRTGRTVPLPPKVAPVGADRRAGAAYDQPGDRTVGPGEGDPEADNGGQPVRRCGDRD